jgi:ubiquinone/menaquinone biosynthesis C-methylase UbiE
VPEPVVALGAWGMVAPNGAAVNPGRRAEPWLPDLAAGLRLPRRAICATLGSQRERWLPRSQVVDDKVLHVKHATSDICDYEGSAYRTEFWEGQGRDYEDRVERIALRRLLPPTGRRLLEIGAGFGRLADLYPGYDQVILLDYSLSLLREARDRLGADRFVYVAANFYQMPLIDGLADTATMVRVIHHAQDVPALLAEIARVLRRDGVLVLEFANKQHLKAILRYALRRQAWSPFDWAPVEFVRLNFDFHPRWMRQQLREAGFRLKAQRTVSHFRMALLKRWVPTPWLAGLDSLLQPTGRWCQLSPSIFTRSVNATPGPPAPAGAFFRCPRCHAPLRTPAPRAPTGDALACQTCGAAWPIRDGIYDFKTGMPG